MKYDGIYGDRSERHQAIMRMTLDELHSEFNWTEDLVFNTTMKKKDFNEKIVPDASCLFGTKEDGSQHRFVVGNEQAEILPKFLMANFVMIESGKTFGNPLTITVDDEQRDRLYAMAREAQLRDIPPFALKKGKKSKTKKKNESGKENAAKKSQKTKH